MRAGVRAGLPARRSRSPRARRVRAASSRSPPLVKPSIACSKRGSERGWLRRSEQPVAARSGSRRPRAHRRGGNRPESLEPHLRLVGLAPRRRSASTGREGRRGCPARDRPGERDPGERLELGDDLVETAAAEGREPQHLPGEDLLVSIAGHPRLPECDLRRLDARRGMAAPGVDPREGGGGGADECRRSDRLSERDRLGRRVGAAARAAEPELEVGAAHLVPGDPKPMARRRGPSRRVSSSDWRSSSYHSRYMKWYA